MATEPYIRIRREDGSRTREHRAVIERLLGRRLDASEIVHHRNGDRHDNRAENLEVTTRAQHSRIHKFRLGTGDGYVACAHCGSRCYIRASRRARGGRFCSRQCFQASRRTEASM